MKSGETLWKTAVAPAYENSMGDGPHPAAPTIDGGTVYVYTGEGVLAALNVSDGKLLWKRDAVREYKSRVTDYGMASSPLIVGENVVVTVGTRAPRLSRTTKSRANPPGSPGPTPTVMRRPCC